MREIRFRGKKVDDNEWVYGDLLTKVNELSKHPAIVLFDGNIIPKSIKVIPETVGQYTGLTDCNGYNNEIYEGDVCDTHTSFGKGIVVFEDGMFKVNGISLCSFREIEVIGNKFENPELVGGNESN